MADRLVDLIVARGEVVAGDAIVFWTAAQMNELRGDIIRWQRLEASVAALPHTNEQLFGWLHDHGINLGAGPGVLLSAMRDDLRKAAGLDEEPS